MTQEYYNELYNDLLVRYKNARAYKCPRTAMARIRDMARLMSEYEDKPYDDCFARLTEIFNDKKE